MPTVDGNFFMRLAILSDIHGNLEALQRAIQLSGELHCEEIICLGDVVGYGPNPSECVDMISQVCQKVVMGNHDHAVLNFNQTDKFNDMARAAVVWTKEHLQASHCQYLAGLPYSIGSEDLLFVHASPNEPESWKYIFDYEDAVDSLDSMTHKVSFVGHTHVPCFFSTDPVASSFSLRKTYKYIVNVGSVGQPRDGDYRLSFGIFDTVSWTYQQVRADYDVQTTVNKIRRTDLPVFLAERLLRGR